MHKIEIAHKIEDEIIELNNVTGKLKFITNQIPDTHLSRDLNDEVNVLVNHKKRLIKLVTTIIDSVKLDTAPSKVIHKLEISHKIEDETLELNYIITKLKFIRNQIPDSHLASDLNDEIRALVDHKKRLGNVVTTIIEDSKLKNEPLGK